MPSPFAGPAASGYGKTYPYAARVLRGSSENSAAAGRVSPFMSTPNLRIETPTWLILLGGCGFILMLGISAFWASPDAPCCHSHSGQDSKHRGCSADNTSGDNVALYHSGGG
ncbi:MAG: hypothetical protein ABSF46_14245 [Terriglobia bacterium]